MKPSNREKKAWLRGRRRARKVFYKMSTPAFKQAAKESPDLYKEFLTGSLHR